MKYFSINSAPCPMCQINPIEDKLAITKFQPLLLEKNYTEIKGWQLKLAYKTLTEFFLKENKL